MNPKVCGELLKTCRICSRMTQQEIADELNYERSYISKIENGEVPMQLEIFTKWVELTQQGWKKLIQMKKILDEVIKYQTGWSQEAFA